MTCLVSNLADNLLFGKFLALFLMGIFYGPVLLTFLLFPLSLLWVITLLLVLEGHHMALLSYSPLIRI